MRDIDFFALALKENCSIWSKDKLFQKQKKISVFTTKELICFVRPNSYIKIIKFVLKA